MGMKKRVAVILSMVSLLAICSVGTLAWFKTSDSITNKFMVADSNGNGTSEFKIEIWETDILNPDVKDYDGIEYENILPGSVLKKNPTVENTGDFDQWVRVLVTFDEYTKLKEACIRNGLSEDLCEWLDINSALWDKGSSTYAEEDDTMTYAYYYKNKLSKDQTAVLFNEVTIPESFGIEDMQFANRDFNISIKAEALQADNTGVNALESFSSYWD